jgi:ABC-type branched-subunit amino acid transport system permease subunit
MIIVMLLAAAVGALCYHLIFRPLRHAPPLARIVASLGLMVYLIGVMGLRFPTEGAAGLVFDGPLPRDVVEFAGVRSFADRFWLALIVVAAALALAAMAKFTNFGLATIASAENESGAALQGISANRIGALNWMIAAALGAVAIILAAPITPISPSTTPLLIVPALGAALLGQFRSILVTVAAGLAIGMMQSEILALQSDWEWLPNVGLHNGIPFLLVLVALLVGSGRTIGRGEILRADLPRAPEPRSTILFGAIVLGAGAIALFFVDSQWRLAITLSAIAAIITLSVIVMTGFVGQISLATYALAGVAAFAMVRAGDDLGLPFPLAPAAGVMVAVAVGTLAGLPAIRVRGLTLAIASLAAAVAVEELVFEWRWFTGGLGGSAVEPPRLGPLDFDIQAVGAAYPREAFGHLTLLVLFGCLVVVVNLRRGRTGWQWLAVRANEMAAESTGISARRAKLSANAVAAALAGVGGTLLAYQSQFVSKDSFGALESLIVLAIAYLAGIAAPIAALIAGALAEGGLLTEALDRIDDDASKYQFAVNGLLLIVAAIRFPAGVVGMGAGRLRRKLSPR